MPTTPRHYQRTWDLAAAPADLWPLVSDTDRFNRDCRFPNVTPVPKSAIRGTPPAHAVRLRAWRLGLLVEWDERPFEWVINQRFGVDRTFHRGPFSRILARCRLEPGEAGGTRLTYEIWFTPANLLGRVALALGGAEWQFFGPFDRVFRHYDALCRRGADRSDLGDRHRFSPGGARRLRTLRAALVSDAGQPPDLIDRLAAHVTDADDLDCQRIRAYALADRWQRDRRATLQACMHAARAGLLDFRWDLVCPHCRGAKVVTATLGQLQGEAYCDTCQIDFVADFERSVELTFTPNASVRAVPRIEYCIGGPQITPHIAVQQELAAGATTTVKLDLTEGRYRIRAPGMARPWAFRLAAAGAPGARVDIGDATAPDAEPILAAGASLELANSSTESRLVDIEHVAWSDQATMACEVTSLQLFRDLFSHEVLRPGAQISVGSLTVVFTDLKDSTRLYRDIGDAPAFSRVLSHFDLLKAAVAVEGGAIVKTMGDAIMAVFPRPAPALRAMLAAQRQLALGPAATGATASRPLPEPMALKAGLHHGPCIAITQNERLDYFGTTVNLAARLCSLCTGTDLLISESVRDDPEVEALLADPGTGTRAIRESVRLRGLANEVTHVHRVARR